MALFGIDTSKRLALIAEIGVNHEGSLDKAVEMLGMAADAGADAVKFQSYTPNRFISTDDPERLARVTAFGLDQDDHLVLKAEAARKGVAFLSSAITEDWVPFLSQHCAAIKIASGDIDFEPVIRAAGETDLPVILSTGTATLDEVRQAVDWATDAMGGEAEAAARLSVLHCVSAYPTPLENANLLAIRTLAEAFPHLTIGYSNHVIGPEACIAAVALGAQVVEVHFTDQKEDRAFRDHALSCDAADLAYLARILPAVAAARGDGVKQPQACEAEMGPAIRKGLVTAKDLPEGHRLTADDLRYARPATEFPAATLSALLGRTLTQAVPEGRILRRSMIAE